jgi:hypothetical protein
MVGWTAETLRRALQQDALLRFTVPERYDCLDRGKSTGIEHVTQMDDSRPRTLFFK